MLSKETFWTYGSRFYSFNNIVEEFAGNKKTSQLPLHATFNHFYNYFVVQSSTNIKLFSIRDGNMLMLH
jgi:hypothetical protein